MESSISLVVSGTDERFFFCLPCARAWSRATWQASGWACPSSQQLSWSEFHPHIGWSHIAETIGVAAPVEGRGYRLRPLTGGSLKAS